MPIMRNITAAVTSSKPLILRGRLEPDRGDAGRAGQLADDLPGQRIAAKAVYQGDADGLPLQVAAIDTDHGDGSQKSQRRPVAHRDDPS